MEAEVRTLREWGATAQAETLETACRQFREAVADWLDQPLTITEAAKECPWWKDSTLARRFAQAKRHRRVNPIPTTYSVELVIVAGWGGGRGIVVDS